MKSHDPEKNGSLPVRVLIVDDHPTNRKLLRAILEIEGICVYEAGDGIEAFAILERENIEAVISDILMPRMDGFQLCHELRQRAKYKFLPLIVYTNTYTQPEDRDLALAIGADEYITKPAAAQEIMAALNRVMKRSDLERQTAASATALTEDLLMKKYASTLVRKLEKKNRELEIAKAKLEKVNQGLEQRVKERTAQLEVANQELDAFCHSVSHDLRAPVRHISGFANFLNTENRQQLNKNGQQYLDRIVATTKRMNELINDLLELSKVNRSELSISSTSLTTLGKQVSVQLRENETERQANIIIADNITVQADAKLLLIVLENLIGNAWKFTSKKPDAVIEVGAFTDSAGCQVCFVRDNGAGFNMQYAGKLFGTFQRLHSQNEFPGTGVGLATVQRIIRRHGGHIWAESAMEQGATFFFTLGES